MTKLKFCNLHNHSYHSVLDGLGSPKEYARKAKQLGQEYVCLTEHANVNSSIELQNECDELGLKSIKACEFYIVEDMSVKEKGEKRAHINVYAKNQTGWMNIQRMISISNISGFYRKPRIDSNVLLENLEGVCVATACVGSFIRHKWGRKLFSKLNDALQEDLYVEVQPHDMDLQREHNELCVKASKKFGRKIIATIDSHYVNKEDADAHDVALVIRTKGKMTDPNRYKFPVQDLYYIGANEIHDMFINNMEHDQEDVDSWIENTIELAEKCCDFRIERQEIKLPQIPQCKGMSTKDENNFLKNLIKNGLKELCPKGMEKEYKERLTEEWGLIERKGFIRYFLVTWEIFDWCLDNDVPVGPGRGSAAGSLILYLIGVTQVDPIKHGLLFARFLSEARTDLPDIDSDFGKEERPMVVQHIRDIYGEGHVTQISNLMYMGMKTAFRDVCRVFDIPNKEVNDLIKLADEKMDKEGEKDLSEKIIYSISDFRKFMANNPKIEEYTFKLTNTLRGFGKHAAGVCVSETNLMDGRNCSLTNVGGTIVSNWDKRTIEHQGLLKCDILGLKEMSIIKICLEYIKENTGKEINLIELEFDDKKVFRMLSQGKTTGIFQLGGYSARIICKEMGIDSFDDIVLASAICRPGADDKEIMKRKKKGTWEKVHPIVDEILNPTYGMLVFQEDLQKIANRVAGMSMEKTEKLRKIVSKSMGADVMNEYKDEFMSGCEEMGYITPIQAEKLWDEFVAFGSYSFNLSHCVSYSYISYWNAWLKINYSAEYLASSLSLREGDSEKALFIDAISNGLTVHLPKVDVSHPTLWKASSNNIYAPLTSIKGIGDAMSEKIINRPKSVNVGFFEAEDQREGLNKSVIEKLDSILFFDKDIKLNRSKLRKINELFEFDTLLLDS